MNKVFLSGRLTRDVEGNFAMGGGKYAKTGIAVDRFSKDKEKTADFFNIVAFGQTAEFLKKYFQKGSKILIEGNLKFSQYEDKQHQKRSSVEVICDRIEFGESSQNRKQSDDSPVPPPDIQDSNDMPFF